MTMKPIRVVEQDYHLTKIRDKFRQRSEAVEFVYNRDLQSRVDEAMPKFMRTMGLDKELSKVEKMRKAHLDLIYGHQRQVEDSENTLKAEVEKLEAKINSYKSEKLDNEKSSLDVSNIELVDRYSRNGDAYSPDLSRVSEWCRKVCVAMQKKHDEDTGNALAVQISNIKELRELAISQLYKGGDLETAEANINSCYHRAGIETITKVDQVPMLAIGNESDSA